MGLHTHCSLVPLVCVGINSDIYGVNLPRLLLVTLAPYAGLSFMFPALSSRCLDSHLMRLSLLSFCRLQWLPAVWCGKSCGVVIPLCLHGLALCHSLVCPIVLINLKSCLDICQYDFQLKLWILIKRFPVGPLNPKGPYRWWLSALSVTLVDIFASVVLCSRWMSPCEDTYFLNANQ